MFIGLTLQGCTGRMVGAVDLAVTVCAIHADNHASTPGIGIAVIEELADMGQAAGSRLGSMALLA